MKLLRNILLLVLTVFASYGLFSIFKLWDQQKSKEEVTSTILLERVEKVYKLVTVEGNFSEIYNYKHHYFADIWPFRKKALIRIKAKVLVGFDLENLVVAIDENNKTIQLNNQLLPEILSIEDDLDYYNFENGIFNVITNQDITEMGARAKDFIREKAKESDLFEQAEEQKQDLEEMLQMVIEAAGWKVVVADGMSSFKK